MHDVILSAISNLYVIGQAVFWLMVWVISATSFTAVVLSRLLAAFGDRRDSGFDFWLASMLGGVFFTLLSSIVLMNLGGLSKWRAYAVILVMLAVGIRRIPKFLKYVASLGQVYIREVRANRILGIAVSLILLYPIADLLLASLVSVRCGDILIYHIWEPFDGKYYLRPVKLGGFYAHLPRNVETIYFWLRLISGGWTAPNLFQALLFFTGMAGLARFFNQKLWKPLLSCLLACTVMMSMSWLYLMARILYIDAAVNSLLIISAITMIHWLKYPENRAAVLACGLAAGLAVGSKYISAYFIICLGGTALIFYLFAYKHDPKLLFKPVLLFVGGCLLTGSFWYFRNWYELGNPIYPFIFGHEGFTDAQMQELAQRIKVFAPKLDLLFFIFPLSDRTGMRVTDSILIPFYFTLGAFVFKKFRRDALFLGVFLLSLFVLVQGHSSLYPRYQAPFYILAAVLGASFLGSMADTRFTWLNRLASLVLVVICAVQISTFAYPKRGEMWGVKALAPVVKNFFGKMKPQDIYCDQVWAAIAIKNLKGSQNFRILYYFMSSQFIFFISPLKTYPMHTKTIHEVESINSFVKENGYTHLVLEDLESFSSFHAIRLDVSAFSHLFEARQKLVSAGTPVALDIPANSVEFYKFTTEDDN